MNWWEVQDDNPLCVEWVTVKRCMTTDKSCLGLCNSGRPYLGWDVLSILNIIPRAIYAQEFALLVVPRCGNEHLSYDNEHMHGQMWGGDTFLLICFYCWFTRCDYNKTESIGVGRGDAIVCILCLITVECTKCLQLYTFELSVTSCFPEENGGPVLVWNDFM